MNLSRKSTITPAQMIDFVTAPKFTEKRISDFKKWKALQEQVNELIHSTSERLGLYIDFLDYIQSNFKKEVQIQPEHRVSFKHTERDTPMGDIDTCEKFRMLKDLAGKVNEKVNVLEQKMQGSLSVDPNTNENYYEIQCQRYNQVKDLAALSEKDLLQEIESAIDINKEEEFIEGFIKEKQKSANHSGEVFSIYKLKSKVMNEKIEKIKKQFEDQSSTVEFIRKLLSDHMHAIHSNLEELRAVKAVDRFESATPADGYNG